MKIDTLVLPVGFRCYWVKADTDPGGANMRAELRTVGLLLED
jgi:hypothetical protein